MAQKIIQVPDIGPVTFVKSARSRHIRISITAKGIRTSLPAWSTYASALAFVRTQRTWIQRHALEKPSVILEAGQRIGKMHTLEFVRAGGNSPRSRVTASRAIVQMVQGESFSDADVQIRASSVAERALKREADLILPSRLRELAAKHGFEYTSVRSKRLQRRWGSCDNQRRITLNYFLMDLPWDCIDYVLLHELTHTEHLNHGSDFWRRMKEVCPRVADIRVQIRRYQPMLQEKP